MSADLPERTRRELRAEGHGPERMVSFAANAEDVVLHRALCEHGVGRYVDVGACSPYFGSVTRHFYNVGWCGIDVEPLSEEATELRRARPRDTIVEAALGKAAGEVTVHVVDDERGLSSTNAAVGAGYLRAGRPVQERVVPLRTLADVLEEHCSWEISFLKVDVEGAEADVLSGNDWERWRPRVVLVEATTPWSHAQSHESWEPLLLAAGYLFASFDGVNRYYARSEEPDLVPMLSPASVLDNFVPENVDRVEGYVRHLEAELSARVSHLAELESYVGRLEEEIGAKDRYNADRVEGYVRQIAELSARIAHLTELESYVGRLEEEIRAKDRHIVVLESLVTRSPVIPKESWGGR